MVILKLKSATPVTALENKSEETDIFGNENLNQESPVNADPDQECIENVNSNVPNPITISQQPKIRLKTSTPSSTLRIKLKYRSEPGIGYDSEDSEREENPLLEDQIILRMKPGKNCDYLRNAVERRELGRSIDFWIKFKDSRHLVVHINGQLYSAVLVDLPCIIEAHKSFDKKSIYKSGNICQMIQVEKEIDNEADYFASRKQDEDFAFEHGLTPPMQYVRKRRFRNRISQKTIEMIELQVDRLLSADAKAHSTTYEILDSKDLEREASIAASIFSNGDLEALISRKQQNESDDDDFLAGQIEQSMLEIETENTKEGSVPRATSESEIGRNVNSETDDEEIEGGSSSSEGETDHSKLKKNQQHKLIRSRIAELKKTIVQKKAQAETVTNPIMSSRFLIEVSKLNAELELQESQLEDLENNN